VMGTREGTLFQAALTRKLNIYTASPPGYSMGPQGTPRPPTTKLLKLSNVLQGCQSRAQRTLNVIVCLTMNAQIQNGQTEGW
jgi:hypothetical protein